MRLTRRTNAGLTIRAVLVALAVFGLLIAAPAVHAEPATVSASGPNSATAGETVTVSFTLTNTGSNASGYVYDLSLPADWRLVDRSDAGAFWKSEDSRWLWTTIQSGDSVTPSVTVDIPESAAGGEYTINGTVKSSDGTEDTVSHTVTVEESGDSGGSSGTGGVAPGDDSSEVDTPENLRAWLSEAPSIRSETAIEDADPEQDGITVVPERKTAVDRIVFANETVSGTVEINVYNAPPEGMGDQIAVSLADSETSAESTIGRLRVVSVTDISPSSTAETPATVTLRVEADRLDDPPNATVVHETDDGWERLETTVVETGSEVTLEADTESFSLFAVVEESGSDSEQQETTASDEQTAGTDTTDSPRPGLPAIGALVAVALLGAVLWIRR